MNEPTHDPIVTLRLELARVTDQRDAYEKSLRTEVLKLLEQVTVSVAVATDKEVNRLKAEVERLAMAGNQSIAVGAKLREMVGDHHWSMEFDRVRTDWCHASRGALSRCQNPNTPPTAV